MKGRLHFLEQTEASSGWVMRLERERMNIKSGEYREERRKQMREESEGNGDRQGRMIFGKGSSEMEMEKQKSGESAEN